MRIVLQRAKNAHVTVDGRITGTIEAGLVVLLGIGKEDEPKDADILLQKIAELRIFNDANGKMNLNIVQTGGALLVVSQFTLYGDIRRGRRPSFDSAAPPEKAQLLYEYFVATAKTQGLKVETGIFRAAMELHLVNDGPVTLCCDSKLL